jgi:hypothetical protein
MNHYLNPKFVYHTADSHDDASAFRERLRKAARRMRAKKARRKK